MKDIILNILKLLLPLFIANALLGTGRIWNWLDYKAIDEDEAISYAKEVTTVLPTTGIIKGSGDTVSIKPGTTVKVVARYKEVLKPRAYGNGVLNNQEFVLMLNDSTMVSAFLPESIIGDTVLMSNNGETTRLAIQQLVPSNNATFESTHGYEQKSRYNFWVQLSDGSKHAFEDISYIPYRFPTYQSKGTWSIDPTAQWKERLLKLAQATIDFSDLAYAMPVVFGTRSVSYFYPRTSFNSAGKPKYLVRGIGGTVEGIIVGLICFILVPFLVSRCLYLPGPNSLIVFISWMVYLILLDLCWKFMVGFTINAFIVFIALFLIVDCKTLVRSQRCYHCHSVGALEQIEGMKPKIFGGWTKWFNSQITIGTERVNVTHIRKYANGREEVIKTSSYDRNVYKDVKKREYRETIIWEEKYLCHNCGKTHGYIHKDTSTLRTEISDK